MRNPNIIYILADDMGYGDVSCLNEYSAFQTPCLDKLGREGAVFTDAHSSSSVCTPSRYSILTGRYNWRSNLKSGVLGGYSHSLIEEGRETVASLLKKHNYTTACIGKWHLGMNWALKGTADFNDNLGYKVPPNIDYSAQIEQAPTTFGFDYFYGISASLDMPPYVYIENDHAIEVPDHYFEGLMPKDDIEIIPTMARGGPCAPNFKHEEVLPKLTEKVLEKITEYQTNPFFIYFPLPAPHTPILPSPQFKGKSGTNDYGDFCLMCDDVVGQVLNQLIKLGIDKNTILIFTSDNGCSPQADYEALKSYNHNPSYHFRGHKADIYEGGHRIPLLIRWPDVMGQNLRIDETVCLTDLMATIADIFDEDLHDCAGEDSISNLPLWMGKKLLSPLREATVHQSIDGSLSIRKGDFKLEMCPGSGGWSYPRPNCDFTDNMLKFQLYNLSEDISEQNNVIYKYPEVFKELKNLLIRYVIEGRSTPGKSQKNNGTAIWKTVEWLNESNL